MTHEAHGVIALITAPDGTVVASGDDFDRSGCGGFELHEAQKIRARDKARGAFFRNTCSIKVAQAINSYHSDSILREICGREGYKEQFILVGHPDADPDYWDYVNRRED